MVRNTFILYNMYKHYTIYMYPYVWMVEKQVSPNDIFGVYDTLFSISFFSFGEEKGFWCWPQFNWFHVLSVGDQGYDMPYTVTLLEVVELFSWHWDKIVHSLQIHPMTDSGDSKPGLGILWRQDDGQVHGVDVHLVLSTPMCVAFIIHILFYYDQ